MRMPVIQIADLLCSAMVTKNLTMPLFVSGMVTTMPGYMALPNGMLSSFTVRGFWALIPLKDRITPNKNV